ncbi:OsmC family protein [Chryseobacterium sp. T1]
MADIKVSAVTGKEAYLTKVTARDHTILIDEPSEQGGKDLAPKPTELLAASLASCTAITLKMYFDRKGWEVGDIVVDVEIDVDSPITKTIFSRSISFSNSQLDEAQLKRVDLIANACPIHKMLSSTIEIKTKINS